MDLWYECENTGKRYIYNSTRVILVGGGYDASISDPVEGTEFECEGLVVGPAEDEEYPLQVNWDNDGTNQYRPEDLHIIGTMPIKPAMEEDNPNKTFRAQKYRVQYAERNENVRKVKVLVETTGVSISEAQHILNKYNSDLAGALAHLNLEGASASDANIAITTENLPKIDIVLNATGLSLTKARKLLHNCGNNAADAIRHHNSSRDDSTSSGNNTEGQLGGPLVMSPKLSTDRGGRSNKIWEHITVGPDTKPGYIKEIVLDPNTGAETVAYTKKKKGYVELTADRRKPGGLLNE